LAIILEDALKSAVIATIEEMSFVALIDKCAGDISKDFLAESLQSMLSVQKPPMKEYDVFILSVSRKLLREIAYNIFGLDSEDEVTDEMETDARSEMLNTIAGRFMREITPSDQSYELGLPIAGKYDIDREKDKTLNCAFESESGETLVVSFIYNL